MKVEKLRRYGRWQPQLYEVFAPPGFCFGSGEHSRLARSRAEARQIAVDAKDLQPCVDPECDCSS